jgi:AcrR family transcriptional regulator
VPIVKLQHRPRDREATEQALLDAAAAAFAQKGYENSTTRGIAQEAGCSEGLIQRYFNGKEGLLLAVLRRRDKNLERVSEFLDRPLCATLTDEAKEMFIEVNTNHTERLQKMRIILPRVMMDSAFRSDFNRISARLQARSRIEARLKRYANAGLLRPKVDIRAAAELLMSMSFEVAFMHREIYQTGEAELEQLIDAFANFYGNAITAPVTAKSRKRP